MAESKEKLKSPLMKVKEGSKKPSLKLSIQKTKIMASSPITSWHIDGEIMETVTDFIFSGFKITVDGNCNHEIKRRLFLGKKADKSRQCSKMKSHYFADKGPCRQGSVFSSSHIWV